MPGDGRPPSHVVDEGERLRGPAVPQQCLGGDQVGLGQPEQEVVPRAVHLVDAEPERVVELVERREDVVGVRPGRVHAVRPELHQYAVRVRGGDVDGGVAELELWHPRRVLGNRRRVVGVPDVPELRVVARILGAVVQAEQERRRPEALEGAPVGDVTLHAGHDIVFHQEEEVPLVPVAGGQWVGGELDRPDDLRVPLVAEVEHVREARQQPVAAGGDDPLRVVGGVGEVPRLLLQGLIGGGVVAAQTREIHLREQMLRGALRHPPIVHARVIEIRLRVAQVGDDRVVDRVDRRARRLRGHALRLLQRQGDRPVHLHQDEVIERPQEAGFRDPLRLAGRVHVHDRRPPDHRVGGVDRPVEVVPGVAEEGLVGVQLGRVVVDKLVTAVGALGVDVRAELRHGEAPLLRPEAAQRLIGGVYQRIEYLGAVVGLVGQPADEMLVQIHAGGETCQQRGRHQGDRPVAHARFGPHRPTVAPIITVR